VDTQRTLDKVNRIKLLPAREYPLSAEGVQFYKRRFRTRFEGDLTRVAMYKDVTEGGAPAGVEYYLPLFFEQLSDVFTYLPAASSIAYTDDFSALLEKLGNIVQASRTARPRHRAPHPHAGRTVPATC
jgi:transcription-repair coupling factor (superfamily II helicase)